VSDSADEIENGFPAAQYAFFTTEGGQWVFRGNDPAEIHDQLVALDELADETEGPGIQTTIRSLADKGILKAGANPAQNKGAAGAAAPAAAAGGLPDWVIPVATQIAGRAVDPSEIKSGIAKSGRNQGQPWYKFGDTFINKPRG